MSDFDPQAAANAINFTDPIDDVPPRSDAPDVGPGPTAAPPSTDPGLMSRIIGEKTRPQNKSQRAARKEREGKAEPETPRKSPEGALVKPLEDFYGSIALMVMVVDPHCGSAVMRSANGCAVALDKAARESPAVRRIVHRLIETSVMGQVVAAHAPIVIAIARHHMPGGERLDLAGDGTGAGPADPGASETSPDQPTPFTPEVRRAG